MCLRNGRRVVVCGGPSSDCWASLRLLFDPNAAAALTQDARAELQCVAESVLATVAGLQLTIGTNYASPQRAEYCKAVLPLQLDCY